MIIPFKSFRLRKSARIKKLSYTRKLSWAEYSELHRGLVPFTVSEKWLIFYCQGWVHFYRSGNGTLVYKLRFRHKGPGFECSEALVNNDPEQIDPFPEKTECRLIDYLIDRLLLHRSEAVFPLAEELEPDKAAMIEKIWMGDSACV